jgi:hypothetical protein
VKSDRTLSLRVIINNVVVIIIIMNTNIIIDMSRKNAISHQQHFVLLHYRTVLSIVVCLSNQTTSVLGAVIKRDIQKQEQTSVTLLTTRKPNPKNILKKNRLQNDEWENSSKRFDVHMSVHRRYISKVQPTRRNVFRYIYFYKLLYSFQAVPPPIIRSTNCTYSVRYCQTNTAAEQQAAVLV